VPLVGHLMVQCKSGAAWHDLPHPLALTEAERLARSAELLASNVPLRLAVVDMLSNALDQGRVRRDERECWALPVGTEYARVFECWSDRLRDACYASLRRRCNLYRQADVRAQLARDAAGDGQARRWAAVTAASFAQPYLFLPSAHLSRWALRVRMDHAPNEDVVRRRAYEAAGNQPALPRLDRPQRACYLCGGIHGVVGVYRPDTLEHVLLFCPAFQAEREAMRVRLCALARQDDAVRVASVARVEVPPLSATDQSHGALTELFTVLRLATGVNRPAASVAADQAHSALSAGYSLRGRARALAEAERARPELQYDHDVAVRASAWVRAMTSSWREQTQDRALCRTAHLHPGYLLVAEVTSFLKTVFGARKAMLQALPSYAARDRDPPG
jgi:hypothetical protein